MQIEKKSIKRPLNLIKFGIDFPPTNFCDTHDNNLWNWNHNKISKEMNEWQCYKTFKLAKYKLMEYMEYCCTDPYISGRYSK